MLSGHQLRSGLVYPTNSANLLALSLFPVLGGMWRKSAWTRRFEHGCLFNKYGGLVIACY